MKLLHTLILLPLVLPEIFGSPGMTISLAKEKPNLVLIVADDLGYADLGIHGCKDIPTPNIDRMAADGIRFTSGYVSGPVCSPSRAGFLTGRYQQRFGNEMNPGSELKFPERGLPLSETTISTYLNTLGYTTGLVGKWHLGYADRFNPLNRGFDTFFGFLTAWNFYVKPRPELRKITRNGIEVDENEYLTDAFGREAVVFIEKNKNNPFFLYLSFNAVHTPLQATEKYLQRFSDIEDEKRRTYAAMVSAMDDAVGRVMESLRKNKLENNTLIVFISDNGGHPVKANSSNYPLRSFKGEVFEGGIRVPFIIQWKNKFPAGEIIDFPVISLDILPTMLAVAGGKVTPEMNLDGINLLPYLTGKEKGIPHDKLFWSYGANKQAVRVNNWKLVLKQGDCVIGLFDLEKDISESNDLSEKHPEKVRELINLYQDWDSKNIPDWSLVE